jgi:small conductance mechanosensitive channel
MNMNIEALKAFAMDYGLKLVGAIVVLVIGLWIIRGITRGTGKFLDKRDIDPSLKPFLRSMTSILLKVLLVISVMGMVGIEMTSFIAILGAAGLAIGLALSGTLQNFAGGVLILILKPYKVGDFIDASGVKGSVFEIQIFSTILKTPDNVTITIPNGSLVNSIITNYTTQPTRRVDWTFGIAYGDSVEKAQEVLLGLIKEDKRIKDDPAPFLALSELADSSVNIVVRVWVDSGDYWGVFFNMNQKVYNEFNKVGINIPFPQMEVHIKK